MYVFKMSDLFTVKLDLSTVTRNEKEKFYILLVDRTKMKMIYQFKLWVRFLFSFDCPIKLIYEGAAIHDLEDVNILTLLKTVDVELADYAGESEQREQLVAKLNRYDEWNKSITPAVTPQKQFEVMNGHSFQNQSRQFHHLGVSKIERNECNSSNEGCGRQHENAPPCSTFSDSHNEANNKSNIRNDKLNTSSNSSSYDGNESGIIHNYNKKCSNSRSSQNCCGPNVAINVIPEITTESAKTSSNTNKQYFSGKRSSAHKPFSLYNFLHTLRLQESNFDDDKIKNDNTMELDKSFDFETSDAKLSHRVDKNIIEEHLIKRKRKRVRKHKNQRSKINSVPDVSTPTLTSLFHEKQKAKSVSVSPKAKHIRFDTDEDSVSCDASKAVEEPVTVQDHSNECVHNSKDELSNDHKFGTVQSAEHDHFMNESNSVIASTVQVIKDSQENGNNEIDVENKTFGDEEVVGNGSLSDSPRSILDILGSLRRKTSTPPVFDRFASCT